MIKKITSHLWFDKEAKEAAQFYLSIFSNSEIKNTSIIQNTPSGNVDVVDLKILNHEFTFISAGPDFKLNPSISFMVFYNKKEDIDKAWETLSKGGVVLMELNKYPFSEKYGWVQDKYGVSWQLMYEEKMDQKIIPTMLFVGDQAGKAEEAIKLYTSVFEKYDPKQSKISNIVYYNKGEEPEKEGTVKHASFLLVGQEFSAMDSSYTHEFKFNEAVSFMVHCQTQDEIDYFWEKLSAYPEAEQCGWLKDKFGVSWQIVPGFMEEMYKDKDQNKINKITEEFLKMKKIDIKKLKDVYKNG